MYFTLYFDNTNSYVCSYPAHMQLVALASEFNMNLFCLTGAFRSEIVKSFETPAMAAKNAARTMSIFKNYIDTRGKNLVSQEGGEFQIYKDLYKIAFPPTHPVYSHLFSNNWNDLK